jgi:hypothetical protein
MAGHDHGHTPAAWTGVTISFIGFCVGGTFVIAAQPAGFWGGMGLILLGPVVGFVMQMMGLGKDEQPLVRTAAPALTGREPKQEESSVHTNV